MSNNQPRLICVFHMVDQRCHRPASASIAVCRRRQRATKPGTGGNWTTDGRTVERARLDDVVTRRSEVVQSRNLPL